MISIFRPALAVPLLPEAEQNQRMPSWRWRILEATFVGYSVYYLVRGNLNVVLSPMADDLGYTRAQASFILACLGPAYGIGKFVLGAVSDRSNPRIFMATGLAVSALCNFAFGFVSDYFTHLALWITNAFFQGAGWPPCGRSLGHWYSKTERGSVFGFWNIAHNVGGGLIGALAGACAQYFGWRYAFFIPGGIALFCALYIFARLRDTPQSVGLRPIEEFPEMSNTRYLSILIGGLCTANALLALPLFFFYPDFLAAGIAIFNLLAIPAGFWITGALPGNKRYLPLGINKDGAAGAARHEEELSFRDILLESVLKNRIIWTFALANFFVYIVRYSLISWGPTYLKETKGVSVQTGGLSTFVFEVSAIVSTLLVGWVSDKAGGRRGMVSLLCMIPILGAFVGMIYLPPGQEYLWAQFLLFGLIGFFIYPPVMLLGVAGLDFTSKKAVGAAAGFIGLFGYLGQFTQGMGLGLLSKEYGWDTALGAIAACACLAILVLSFTWKLKPED